MNAPLSHVEAAKKYLSNEPLSREEASGWSQRSDEAGRRYFSLQYAISKGMMLAEVPRLFVAVVKNGDWRRWKWAGQDRDAPTLAEYVTRKPPNGLGATLEMAGEWVRDDADALAIFIQETTGKHGGDRSSKFDNIKLEPPTGTSRAYTVRRLKEERPDLYEEVRQGLSVNKAASKAGWRKTQEPFAIMKRHVHKLTTDEWDQLMEIRRMGPQNK